MDEDEKDLLDEDLDESEESDESSDSGSDDSAPPSDDDSKDEGEKGRINDLMSKWQKAEARAKKAEAALKARSKPDSQDEGAADGGKPEGNEFLDFQRQAVREQLFNADPRFKEVGLTVEAITGDTLAEMKASAKAQLALIASIETRARNKVLREHGLEPEVSTGAATEKATNFGEMSQEEFEKFLQKRDSQLR